MNNKIVAENAGILMITDIFSKILRTILAILIARKLGASDLGLLKYAMAFTTLFSFIPGFGFKNFINREIAKHPENSGVYFSNLSIIKLFLSAFTFVLILLAAYLLKIPHEQLIIFYYVTFIMFLDSFIEFYTAFFRGFQKAKYEALLLLSSHFLVTVSGIAIIYAGFGLQTMIVVRFFATLIMFVVGFLLLKIKLLHAPYKISGSFCLKLLKKVTPFTVLTILVIVNTQIGIVLLTRLKDLTATGFYTAALNLCGIFQFLPASVAGAIIPAMTKLTKENNHIEVETIFSKSIKYLLILVIPVATGTTIMADKIILLIYGNEFSQSILTLRILIWVIILSFSNTIFNAAFISIHKEKKYVFIQILGTIIYISLCLFLIPLYNHNGVAIAYTFTQLIIFIIAVFYISKYFETVKITSILFKPSVAAIIMFACIFFIRSFSLAIVIPVAMIVYLAAIIILKIFNRNELRFIRSGVDKIGRVFNNRRLIKL